jgi:hypothetical protein
MQNYTKSNTKVKHYVLKQQRQHFPVVIAMANLMRLNKEKTIF